MAEAPRFLQPVSGPIAAAASTAERFAQVAREQADQPAVQDLERCWTFAELRDRAGQLAQRLLDSSLAAGEPVAVLAEPSVSAIGAMLGTMLAGGMHTCLDPSDPVARQRRTLEVAPPRILVSDRRHAAQAEQLAAGRVPVLVLDPADRPRPTDLPAVHVPLETPAWLRHTSGSTGQPRGVYQSHGHMLGHTQVYADVAGLGPGDRLTELSPLGTGAATTPIFASFLTGATLCIFPVREQGVERLAGWLHDQRVTVYHSVPTLFRHLARAWDGAHRFEHLRVARLAGEPVSAGDVGLLRRCCSRACRLMHVLASTETGMFRCLMLDADTPAPGPILPVGYALPGTEVCILDDAGSVLSPGQQGRIAVVSPRLPLGYWRDPEGTAAAYRVLDRRTGLRMFISNDLGRLGPDGCLEHRGRADRQVKVRGHRIGLEEVEAAIHGVAGVAEVAVTAPADRDGQRRLVAYVAPTAAGATPDLRPSLRSVLPERMVPEVFVFLPVLPQQPGGKVDRAALPPPPPPKPARHRGPAPRDQIEKTVALIWEDILGVEGLGIRQDFFDLGGTSLQSARILARIEDTFGQVLPVSALVEHGTIQALAAALALNMLPRCPQTRVALRARGRRRPLFLVPGGGGNPSVFGPLARHLDPEQPVYGFRSVGLNGEAWPPRTLPAIARRFVREVLQVDAAGPFQLGGSCMGGLVALEMAQQLRRQGKAVAFLALINCGDPSVRGLRGEWHHRLARELRDSVRIGRWVLGRGLGLGRHGWSLPAYRRFVGNMNSYARRHYRPRPYDGAMCLYVSQGDLETPTDPRLGMASLARRATVTPLPGKTETALWNPTAEELGRRMEAELAAANA